MPRGVSKTIKVVQKRPAVAARSTKRTVKKQQHIFQIDGAKIANQVRAQAAAWWKSAQASVAHFQKSLNTQVLTGQTLLTQATKQAQSSLQTQTSVGQKYLTRTTKQARRSLQAQVQTTRLALLATQKSGQDTLQQAKTRVAAIKFTRPPVSKKPTKPAPKRRARKSVTIFQRRWWHRYTLKWQNRYLTWKEARQLQLQAVSANLTANRRHLRAAMSQYLSAAKAELSSLTHPTVPQKPLKQVVVAAKPKRKKRITTAKVKAFFAHLAWRAVRPFYLVLTLYPAAVLASILLTMGILSTSYGLYLYVFDGLPAVEELTAQQPAVTTKILDRNGKVLFSIYKDENRTIIPLSQVPTSMVQATIAIEDKEFFSHHGFSLRGIIRAFRSNLKGETVQGGSTITQQLVKNRLLSPERTLRRKIREVLLAVLVDGSYSKEEILEMYFNQVAYGGSTYGVEEASQRYFGKPARQLSLAESALLAGLPAAPSAYSPYGPTPELAFDRQSEVLRRMVEDGYITQADADQAKQQPIEFRPDRVDIKAPHFVMYVKKILAERFGEEAVSEGGLVVRTTLDLDLHTETQKIVTDEVDSLARLRITNGAALITNPKTGEVLSMVGSKDYFDFAHDGQVNVTLRPRQPGSSIKPLTYALAFEKGKSPSTTIEDNPISFQLPGTKPYAPKNYDNRFHGTVTLRQALGSSYNIPAVKLAAELGIPQVIDKGEQMGISTWLDRSRFGLSLTLGGGEVLMIDMNKLYGTFANQGYTVPIEPLLEVTNFKGDVLYRNDCALDGFGCAKRKTLDTRVAYQITDVLKDNGARTPAFGPRSLLVIPNQEVAVKTGTTNSLRDNWTIGYTSDRVVAVWVGNNDNTPMSYVASGVTGASPIWNKITRFILDENAPHHFGAPEGLVKVQICARTGTLPCRGCPVLKDEYFVPGTEPTQACNPAQFMPKPKPTEAPEGEEVERDRILEGLGF
jgi:penicillin-binding protein 1C